VELVAKRYKLGKSKLEQIGAIVAAAREDPDGYGDLVDELNALRLPDALADSCQLSLYDALTSRTQGTSAPSLTLRALRQNVLSARSHL
jgi:hypothetical protein